MAVLDPNTSQQVSWKLKVNEWYSGIHHIPIALDSLYTKPSTINVPVRVTLGKPKGKLYYSEPSIFLEDYGYIWITLMDMPTFSGLNLRLTWDPRYLKPIRVSPEPWLVESMDNAMDGFSMTDNVMEILGVAAENPPWRMIIGK